jgi:anti-anti-sigma factor
MFKPTKASRDRLTLSPNEPLVAGGPAEGFERHVQALFRQGYRRLVIDLQRVRALDSAGVRALIRGHTSAQRVGGTFRLVGAGAEVRGVLQAARLDSVLEICDSLEAAEARPWPWPTIRLVAGGALLVAALVWGGVSWSILQPAVERAAEFPGTAGAPAAAVASPRVQPFIDLGKLVAAAAIGVLVTGVSRRYRQDRPQTQSMEQAQVLLCVSGAMMMVIIGSSLARAFGIAGAASIIRFRTPVEDPKDITVLFLLMGLGMAAGLGAFALAGVGAAFLCVTLVALERFGGRKPRVMTVELRATGRDFPIRHVESAFVRYGIVFEPRQVSQGDESVVQYHTKLDPDTALEDVSQALMGDGTAGIQSVVWEVAKRKA